jgi:cytochrome c oxidase assembly protein subunit 15
MQESVPLVNLSPLFGVLMAGLGVAALVIFLWSLKRKRANQRSAVHSLCLLTLFLCLDLVIFGAFTRLTDSGLGCPDWPGCYGHASPIGARDAIDLAHQQMPTGPVSPKKAWIEMIHRYLAAGVGLLILLGTAHAWWYKLRQSPKALRHFPAATGTPEGKVWLPTLALVWVITVGLFGALTVTMRLYPAIVTLHLLGAMALLTLLTVQACRYEWAYNRPRLTWTNAPQTAAATYRLRWLAPIVAVLLWLQIALGGWVSTNYAVLACDTFPMCQDSWWPKMNFVDGFSILRPLGMTTTGEFIDFSALVAIHYSHRLMAYVVIAAMLLLAWSARSLAPTTRKLSLGLGLIAVCQLLTGMANVVLNWPLVAALLHTTGAALAVILITALLCLQKLHAKTSPSP